MTDPLSKDQPNYSETWDERMGKEPQTSKPLYTARHPAAFINAIADEGTKSEAVEWLQRTWDELCDLRAAHEGHSESD